MRTSLPLFLAVAFISSGVTAPAQPAASGRWEGVIEVPGSPLPAVVTLRQDAAGTWNGTVDIEVQALDGAPLADIAFDPPDLKCRIEGIPGRPTFRGRISDDGTTWSGKLIQGFGIFPFSFRSAAAKAAEARRRLEGYGDLVREALEKWNVPGAAIAIVQDDEVLLCQGFGFRDAAGTLPVTKDTLFAIGSATKAFTATVLAMLAEDGRLALDEPVAAKLPEFRLKDPLATAQITARDLLCHRSGLPRHDLVWYGAAWSRGDLLARLRFLEPSAGLREKWQYQNLMFMAAGCLAEKAGGSSWEGLVRERIFGPLGMARSNLSVEDSKRDADHARPCHREDGEPKEIPFRPIDAVGPAGSINSSASDMSAWLRLQTSGGRMGGARLLRAASIAELHRPQIVMPDAGKDPEIVSPAYGLGWMIDHYRGRIRVHHGGAIDGFVSQVAFLPDVRAGVVVLANLDGSAFPEMAARTALDRLAGLDPIDWNARLRGRSAGAEAAGRSAATDSGLARKPDTQPSHPLADYAGAYEHPAYGTIEVTAEDGKLRGTLHGIPFTYEHWHYDTFRAEPEDPYLRELKFLGTFQADRHGDIARVAAVMDPLAPEVVFARLPPARLRDPGFLAGLCGAYEMTTGGRVTIASQGGCRLTLQVPGQPVYGLEPRQGLDFDLKGLSGFTARFVLAEDGTPAAVHLLQPNGVFKAKREGRER